MPKGYPMHGPNKGAMEGPNKGPRAGPKKGLRERPIQGPTSALGMGPRSVTSRNCWPDRPGCGEMQRLFWSISEL